MKSILSQKGQITIPKKIRERLGLQPGVILDFQAKEGQLIAIKTSKQDSLDEVVGLLRGKLSDVDHYLKETRGSG